MKIPVVGFDPSFNNWGIAQAELDLTTGFLSTPVLHIIQPEEIKAKQVRVNSKDLFRAKQLSERVLEAARAAKAIFVEVPHGSQSARAMASYGVCVGILSTLLADGHQLIEVSASEVKLALTNKSTASKEDMITSAMELYPEANFPRYRGGVAKSAEHVADAIGAIHAGVNTPLFKNLMKLIML